MTRRYIIFFLSVFTTGALQAACSQNETHNRQVSWTTMQNPADTLISIRGFSGPEAVRYDPDQEVYFVSNFTGGGGDRDSTGFISKVSYDGTIDSLRFMRGTEGHPLHAPRGMFITGDTLWACDIDGVHGFNRMSGEHLAFVDFTKFEPGFLNDIVEGADGALYVTDTGTSSVYKMKNGMVSVAVDSLPAPPNGITVGPGGSLVLAPWGGSRNFFSLSGTGADTDYMEFASAESGGNFDGIELLDGRLIAASQADSSLHVLYEGNDHILVHVPGRPADIGLDTKRNRVAVPYIALNRVDIWKLPD